MGRVKKFIKGTIKRTMDARYEYVITKGELEKIDDRRLQWEHVQLTDEQVREIEAVYGPGADTRWHRFFQYFTGKFDARYLPDIVFAPVMECRLNPKQIASEMEDKIRIPILFSSVPGLKIPDTIVSNASGIYYDGNASVISRAKANELVKQYLEKHNNAIMKPTRGTYAGDGVIVLSPDSFSELEYEKDFIVQEKIVNQEDIRALNPSSLNTMRVITYICDEKYWCAPIAMRMGIGPGHLDNISAGGICIGVKENGELCSQAYSEYSTERYDCHPYTKVKFEGYRIKNIDKVITAAIECHKRLPHMRMASWDFTLNDKGQPTLIEVNLNGQSVCFPQYTHGKSLFGDNTEKMLEILK